MISLYGLLKFLVNDNGWGIVLKTLIDVIAESNPNTAERLRAVKWTTD